MLSLSIDLTWSRIEISAGNRSGDFGLVHLKHPVELRHVASYELHTVAEVSNFGMRAQPSLPNPLDQRRQIDRAIFLSVWPANDDLYLGYLPPVVAIP